MRRQRTYFFSIRYMLMASFFLLILLPYLLTTTFYTLSMRRQLEKETTSALSSDNSFLLRGIDTMLSDAQRVAYLHLIDQDITRILQTSYPTYDLAFREDERTMINAIKHATSLNSNILAVTFYAMDGSIYQMSHASTMKLDAGTDWMKIMRQNGLREYVSDMQPYSESAQGLMVIPLIYMLSNSLDTQNIGYVRVDYNLKSMWDGMLQQLGGSADYALFQGEHLLWDSGSLFTQNDPLIHVQTPSADGETLLRVGKQNYALSRADNNVTRLSTYAYTQLDPMSTPVMRSIIVYLLILGAMLLADLLFSWIISKQIGNSIRELAFAMDNAQHGQNRTLPVKESPMLKSELDQLRSSYNAMIDRLLSSARNEYEARVQQKNIAMRVLESQINPHFLYNALNLIASLAQLKHQDDIRGVAISLASMLRYSIKGGSIVSLEEELYETRHYIRIMQMRFPDRIVVKTHVEASLLSYRIPKLLLQPLLENACKYATDTPALMVIIEISVQSEDDDLLISVTDNGPGIMKEKLTEILGKLDSYHVNQAGNDDRSQSLGLINVHARVRAHYGEPYGLSIKSTDHGCCILIKVPKVSEK